jgi:hypothetical protein
VGDAAADALFRVAPGPATTTIASGLPLDSIRSVIQVPTTGHFIVGSYLNGRVLRITPEGRTSDMIPPGRIGKPAGVARDPNSGRLFVLRNGPGALYELTIHDCNGTGVPDDCDIAAGTSEDCNDNQTPDECDIASGYSPDNDENGVPDECEIVCVCGDLDGAGGQVDLADFAVFATCFGLAGPTTQCDLAEYTCSDLDASGVVDLSDFATFALMYGMPPAGSPPDCLN